MAKPEADNSLKGAELIDILEKLPAAVAFVSGPDLAIRFSNEKFRHLFSDYLKDKPLKEIFPEVKQQKLHQMWEEALESGEAHVVPEVPFEKERDSGESEQCWYDLSLVPLLKHQRGSTRLLVFVYDVSVYVRGKKSVEEESSPLSEVVESIPQIAWVTDYQGKPLYFNQQWYEYTGLDPQESPKKSWTEQLHPGDRERARNEWQKSLEQGSDFLLEYRLRKSDDSYEWFMVRGRCVENKDQKKRWYGTLTQIHEQVLAKQAMEKAYEKLGQKGKEQAVELIEAQNQIRVLNQELEQLASILSYDIRGPLRGINSLAEWIEQDYATVLGIKGHQHLQFLRDRVKIIYQLIEGMMAYSRTSKPHHSEFTQVDVGALVDDVVKNQSVPEQVTVEVKHPLPKVNLEELRLYEIFTNLINNALKNVDPGEGKIEVGGEKKEQEYLFWVKDNGIGVALEQQGRIFDLFQTVNNKEVAKGRGVGLAITKKIIELCGGEIWVKSKLGEGATFYFTLPLKDQQVPQKKEQQ